MSFFVKDWATAFSPAFHEDAKAMLETALNKGNKPPVIQGRIEVVELSMGKEPPTLTLLEIGDLSLDRFRGILRLGYQGDAWLEVRCRVQANPLSHNPNLLPSSTLPLSTPLLASQPLLVPMTLRLSKLHLRAILILVVSKAKGITLVFKNDPLQNVDVSSTFDSVEVIRGYLQQEIEGQLREMFREDLPGIIHRLSQRWFTGTGVGGKVEMPYREEGYAPSQAGGMQEEDNDEDVFNRKDIFPPPVPSTASPGITPRRRVSSRVRRTSTAASESPTSYTIFPEIEEFDPTYGLRPEGVPTHSGYEAFGRLWEKARQGEGKGLGALMSKAEEDRGDVSDQEWDEDEAGSFDLVEMEESLRALGMPRSQSARSALGSPLAEEDEVEWETFPAVGGGVITRPRVYHSQSQIRAPSEAGGAMPSPSGTATQGSVTARASSIAPSSTLGSMRKSFPLTPMTAIRPNPGPSSLRRLVTSRSDVFLSHQASRSESYARTPAMPPSRRPSATNSSNARASGSSWDTDLKTRSSTDATSSRPLSIDAKASLQPRYRASSVSVTGTSPGKSFPPRHIGPGGITLPLNNSVSQLATLSHSAHTLSPYARGHEHIAVRSFPHLGKTALSGGSSSSTNLSAIAEGTHGIHGPVKARRKRIFHINKTSPEQRRPTEPLSPDIDDEVFRSNTPSPDGEWSNGRSRSPVGMTPMDTRSRRPVSLTGVAQRVMTGSGMGMASAMGSSMGMGMGTGMGMGMGPRPNYGRAPASRSSYGFPAVSGARL